MFKKIIVTILFFCLIFPFQALAADTQMIIYRSTGNIYSSGTNYYGITSGPGGTSSESLRKSKVAAAGVLDYMLIELTVAPGSGKSRTFTIRKNGADTGLSCAVSNTATTCNDTSSTVTFAAGDDINIKQVVSGASVSHTNMTMSVRWDPTTADEFIYMGGGGYNTGSATGYHSVHNYFRETTEKFVRAPVPFAGQADKFYVKMSTTPGSGKSYAFTLRQNGSDTSLTCTISDSSTTCSDTSNTVSLSAHDTLTVSVVPTNTPSNAYVGFGMIIDPTTAGDFYVIAADDGSPSNNTYNGLHASGLLWTGTEADIPIGIGGFYMTGVSVYTGNTPAGGSSITITVRHNKADTDISCTISNPDTACNDTGSATLSDSDGITLHSTDDSGTAIYPIVSTHMTDIDPSADRRIIITQ